MLLASEIARARYELSFNALTVGAEPYISVVAIFDQVIKTYMGTGLALTSATPVTAVGAGNSPTPVTLTVSATGVAAFDQLVIDVDSRQELATCQSVTGTSVTVQLSLAHSGTYPVMVEGGESMFRGLLRKLRALDAPGGPIEAMATKAGVKKVDEIEFFGDSVRGNANAKELKKLRRYYRHELAKLCGIESYWMAMNATSGSGDYAPC